MELSWLMRLRIAAAVGIGVVVIGFGAWPMVRPAEPFGVVLAGNLTSAEAAIVGVLAFLAGLAAYFASWPYGRQIGILAVPAGLAVWALRGGDVASLMVIATDAAESALARGRVFSGLKWEGLLWLGMVAAGFAGVLAGAQISGRKGFGNGQPGWKPSARRVLETAGIVLATVVVSRFCINLLAQDARIADIRVGMVAAQAVRGQVIFAVFGAFCLAGFAARIIFNESYLWPAAGAALVTPFSVMTYGKSSIIGYMAQHWPANFFAAPALGVLPVQMVSVGVLGAVAGYWLAERYRYWRRHECRR